jgi:hypothetical protein
VDQSDLDEARRRQLARAFANYVTMANPDLDLSTTGDDARAVWRASQLPDQRFIPTSVSDGELSEIALRLEPAICSEAPSERTLGQQRRFLAPHRMRMKRDSLLARTALAESGEGAKLRRPRMTSQRRVNP